MHEPFASPATRTETPALTTSAYVHTRAQGGGVRTDRGRTDRRDVGGGEGRGWTGGRDVGGGEGRGWTG